MKTKAFILVIGIILVISFIVILITYKKALSASSVKKNALKSLVFKSADGDIEYILEGSGPTILISHGVTGGIDQGIGLSNMYLGPGYRYLYLSRFGYLKSSIPDKPSAKLQAKAYKDLLDYLDIDSVFILGNSAGGTSAIQFTIDYPERCTPIEGARKISTRIPNCDLVTFEVGGHLILDHEQEIKKSIHSFISR